MCCCRRCRARPACAEGLAVTRLVLGPFNRVEGDLEVQLEVSDGRVTEARVSAPLYRGFEGLLVGRDPMDALTIAPRICGICSVSQSVAAAKALADAAGLRAAANGLHATNLMLACENLADHLTHFYVFFMPDFTRDEYAQRGPGTARRGGVSRPWPATARAAASTAAGARRARALAGADGHARRQMAAHAAAILPGGTSRAIEAAERVRLLPRLREMRAFLEAHAVRRRRWKNGPRWTRQPRCRTGAGARAGSDLRAVPRRRGRRPVSIAGPRARAATSATAPTRRRRAMRSHAACGTPPRGSTTALDAAQITEDMRHAWLAEGEGGRALHPSQGVTQPAAGQARRLHLEQGAAPGRPRGGDRRDRAPARRRPSAGARRGGGVRRHRLHARAGAPAGTGAAAADDGAMAHGAASRTRRSTRPRRCRRRPKARACRKPRAARWGTGCACEHGRIARYQIIAPTSWNFSPRDADGVPGALEMALVGAPVEADAKGRGRSVAVQHIVRSFDPCMVCTVH